MSDFGPLCKITQTMESLIQAQKVKEKEKQKSAEKQQKEEALARQKKANEALANEYIRSHKASLYEKLTTMEKQFWSIDSVPESALRPHALEALKIKI